jgi:excisionase family DNA binding protein
MPSGGSNRLLRIPQAAEYLNVPERTLRDEWRRGGLQAHRIGRAIMFRERELERFIDSKG